MVVTGLNSRSRNVTPCSLSASRMRDSVKESAKGKPRSRAKRARTSSSVIIGDLKCLGHGAGQEARSRARTGRRRPEQESPSSLYAARVGHSLWPQLRQGPTLALKLATFVFRTDAHKLLLCGVQAPPVGSC